MINTDLNTQTKDYPINSVLKNTYMLLGMTLLFSASMAGLAIKLAVPQLNIFLVLITYFALLFLVHKTANTGFGIIATFLLTGFLGFTLGPIISQVLSLKDGGLMIMQALGSTAVIFFALSAYAIAKKDTLDLSSWGPYISIILIVSFVMSLINYFFIQSSGLSILVSIAFTIISSGLILFETNQIIRGGERNYILATITLYVAIYNIFINLLNLILHMND